MCYTEHMSSCQTHVDTHLEGDASVERQIKLLDQMRAVLWLKHMSIRTEEAYVSWVRRFILFHGKRHPTDMGAEEIRAFLMHLAVHGKVARVLY
jgi:glucan phosphorylase